MCVDVEVCTPHGCVDVEISQYQTAGCFQRGEGGNECSNDGAEYFLPGGFVASLGHISSSFFLIFTIDWLVACFGDQAGLRLSNASAWLVGQSSLVR